MERNERKWNHGDGSETQYILDVLDLTISILPSAVYMYK